MRLRQPQFPGQAGVVNGAAGRGAGAAVIARDQHHLGARLGHTGGDGTHAGLRHQLYADAGVPVGIFEIVDQLRKILDGIDVVVGRRADETDAGR